MPNDQEYRALLQKVKELEQKVKDLQNYNKDRIHPLLKAIYIREGDSTQITIGSASLIVDWQGVTIKGQALHLEAPLTGSGALNLVTGDASIVLKKDGSIKIKGKDIVVEGSGDVNINGNKDVTLKGKKILQN
jgi:hypothetical protein